MKIALEKEADVAIVAIRDESLDQGNVDAFLDLLGPFLDACPNIAIDIGQLVFVDSSGLSSFAHILSRTGEHDGRVCVFNVRENIRDTIQLVHLDEHLDIYDSRDAALASFAGPRGEGA